MNMQPPASPPNNPAIVAGDTIYCGGLAPIDLSGRLLGSGDIALQTRAVLERMRQLLQAESCGLERACFVTVYLAHQKDYPAMNEAYAALMPQPYPARKVVVAPMFREGVLVEMTIIASRQLKRVVTG